MRMVRRRSTMGIQSKHDHLGTFVRPSEIDRCRSRTLVTITSAEERVVSESTGPSLLTLSVPFSETVPWEMAPLSGAVRLMPSRQISWPRRIAMSNEIVHLSLLDLGVIDDPGCGVLTDTPPSDQAPSHEIVLLLPSSLSSTVAELHGRASTSTFDGGDGFDSHQWLPTWHRYINIEEGLPADLFDELAAQATRTAAQPPSPGSRRYIYGSVLSPDDIQQRLRPELFAVDSPHTEFDLRHPVFRPLDRLAR